jgi:hypothetical protein
MPRFIACLITLTLLTGTACQYQDRQMRSDEAEMSAAAVDLLLPRGIQIESFTQPISRSGDGRADAIEVIVAARDSSGDPTKAVGTFQFELYDRKPATAMPAGQRLSYWRMDLSDQSALEDYWDNFARYYRFPLELESLKAGDYILRAQYTDPTGRHLFDEYDLVFDGASVPSLSTPF